MSSFSDDVIDRTRDKEFAEKTEGEVLAELREAKAKEAEKKRSETLNEAKQAYYRQRNVAFTIESPIATPVELRERAEKKSVSELSEMVKNVDSWIAAYRNEAQRLEPIRRENIAIQHDTIDSPARTKNIEAEVSVAMSNYKPYFTKLELAIPYLKEIREVYAKVLVERNARLEMGRLESPVLQKKLNGISEDASKLREKIAKRIEEAHNLEATLGDPEKILRKVAEEIVRVKGLEIDFSVVRAQIFEIDPDLRLPDFPASIPSLSQGLWVDSSHKLEDFIKEVENE